MASSDILSQTFSSITSIKLDEISSQRATFEAAKSDLLTVVNHEVDPRKKVQQLLEGIEHLDSMSNVKDSPIFCLKNIKQFIEQAHSDPSVSTKLQKDWQAQLGKALDIQSLKFEYASLYGRLVNEWLSVSEDNDASDGGSDFEPVGRKEMHEQRAKWEEYVFKTCETDETAIHLYLDKLFKTNKAVRFAFDTLWVSTVHFEKEMASAVHFDDTSLKWVIEGLLRSDLVTDEKRKVLKDFLNNKVVLGEVADVLNMRMSSLDKWHWDPAGSQVEIRRQLNGRYRFYHDEDLLQAILLRYIGVKWSVHFKSVLTAFQSSEGVWKSSSRSVPSADQKRRDYFLGPKGMYSASAEGVEGIRRRHFEGEIFLEQLAEEIDERRGGYGDDSVDERDTRKSSQQITQTLLHTLASEIIMKTRLGEEMTVVRTDFEWFGPSLPHSTMFSVLKYFRVCDRWLNFFHRVLEAPMKFIADGNEAPVMIRKRGTPISGPMSDMLGETVLFCLDFAFNQLTDGARMYRLHNDICWKVMTEFSQLTGLNFNQSKTGSVKVTRRPGITSNTPSSLPKGDVRWGFLKLDGAIGRFLIDQENVDTHIEELRRQLEACKSVFDWIQAWNVYGARFFTNNFGKPANCFGLSHVDMMLETFSRIQSKLFASTGGSVTSTLKNMISERFEVDDIPEGYLYFPMSMGGLDLKSPFVNLYLIRDTIMKKPDAALDQFFLDEEKEYRVAKANFERGNSFLDSESFMTFEEFTRYREQTSKHLYTAYSKLIEEPVEDEVTVTTDVANENTRGRMNSYNRWIIQLYAPDMMSRFGGLNVVEKGLLPTGMVSMFRESRFKWQG
ncbi:uncharacterized protein K444DRAFT_640724 [Hyaloscypha bicolor E]|uniref:Reverse transcriptase domain-containing protein n=1 Tax=Hyaloscypha bicolor E TaxID=1095630 RepID=A0A2J6TPU8_9HELO|nr:uncharacterized protein K444DRAFT_640724 [Hyaloscypha bicolor E]PMD65044.1 hypothetical protein K444DRAFT_640724 [Hyaloscypha bicolor E]